jgi:hypothetical protein
VIGWVRQLSPEAKLDVLRILAPELDELETLADYSSERMRVLAAARGIDWDGRAANRNFAPSFAVSGM